MIIIFSMRKKEQHTLCQLYKVAREVKQMLYSNALWKLQCAMRFRIIVRNWPCGCETLVQWVSFCLSRARSFCQAFYSWVPKAEGDSTGGWQRPWHSFTSAAVLLTPQPDPFPWSVLISAPVIPLMSWGISRSTFHRSGAPRSFCLLHELRPH